MTRREIVIQALQHKETNPIPYVVGLETPAVEKLIAYTGDPDIIEKTGNYIVGDCYGI